MARLILSLDGQVMAEYNMNKERYTIGRLPDNDIRIDNAAVSGHHSLIINILNDSFLEDLNSTNGTYVNGKLIKKHALQHGDVITVGHHQLRFVEDDEQQDEFEKTMVIQPSARPVEKMRAAARGGREGRVLDLRHRQVPRARWRRGRQEGEAAGALGRLCGPRARTEQGAHDARTPGRAGGRHHAPCRRATSSCTWTAARPDDFPLVNGTPIGAQATKLNDNDVIQLAGVKMGFFVN